MIEIYRWRKLERWDAFSIPHLHVAPHLPQARIGDLLTPRHERIDRTQWRFEQLQPITIHFGGSISRRKVAEGTVYSLPLFWAKPGDVVLSKIDLKNGAVGVLPEGWENAVVTSHFKVYTADTNLLDARFFRLLLQTKEFKEWLWANRSGADGRTEVKLDVFEALEIPLPPITEQAMLCNTYAAALDRAAKLELEAQTIEEAGLRAFEEALGVAAPPPLPYRPVFVARFKDVERWSHDGILRAAAQTPSSATPMWPHIPLGEALLEVKHGCSAGPTKVPTQLRVLKISAVTKGRLDLSAHKYIADKQQFRAQFSLLPGDILMCRTNGTLAYVGMSALVEDDVPDTIFPDKIIRVRPDTSKVDPTFLWRLLQLPFLRTQVEAAARTAVGNFAIGGKDIKLLNVPCPPPDEQRRLVAALIAARQTAATKRTEAQALRATAWTTFESELFAKNGEPEK